MRSFVRPGRLWNDPGMDGDDAWALLARERRAFADLLDSLTPQQWEQPSLCDGWTVREVATHMMVGPTGSVGGFLTAMIKARGRFDRANQVMVDRRSTRPTAEIADDFRLHAENRFSPPGFDWHAPLTDFLLHRLDVSVPLGLSSDPLPQAWQEALGFLVGKRARTGFVAGELPSLSYGATDVDWGSGTGPHVLGPAEVLALAMTGRPHRLDELAGDGADALRVWARRASTGSR